MTTRQDIDFTSVYHYSLLFLLTVFVAWKSFHGQAIIWTSMTVACFVTIKYLLIPIMIFKVIKPPTDNPEAFIKRKASGNNKRDKERTLVCIGDSITCAKVSSNYVDKVKQMLQESHSISNEWNVVNAGVNSTTTFDVLTNIQTFEKCDPDFVTILIGTNDIKALFNEKWKERTESQCKGKLSFDVFELNLTNMIRSILTHTKTRVVALCTIPPMGEDMTSGPNAEYVHKANTIIDKVVSLNEFINSKRVISLDTNRKLREKIEEGSINRRFYHPVSRFEKVINFVCLFHVLLGLSWNTSSKLVLGPSSNVVSMSYSDIYESFTDCTILIELISIT
jgi:lysophospholipase L1-like esterase